MDKFSWDQKRQAIMILIDKGSIIAFIRDEDIILKLTERTTPEERNIALTGKQFDMVFHEYYDRIKKEY